MIGQLVSFLYPHWEYALVNKNIIYLHAAFKKVLVFHSDYKKSMYFFLNKFSWIS